MRRLFVFVLLLPMMLCCSKETKQIVFWQFQPPDVMQELIRDFIKENPADSVSMETLTWQSGFEKIVMAFSSGNPPDLLELGSTWLGKFADQGVLEDLTGLTSDLTDSLVLWDLATFKGRIYGIPWLIGSRVLFFNRDLMRKAGLDPDLWPETWDQLLDYVKRIHKPQDGIYGFGMNAGERYILYKKFMPFAWSNGGEILSEDFSRCVINSPENLEALEFYISLKEFSILERQEMIDELFKQGRIGMMISGGWNLERIPKDSPMLDFGVALIPKPEGGRNISFAGAEILVIPKGSNIESAIKLARYLVSPGNALRVASRVRSIQPAHRSAIINRFYEENPMDRILLEQCWSSKSPPSHPSWIEIEEIINSCLEKCLYGDLTPSQALEVMQRGIDEVIAR
ncbi:MAG: extracellular solute-binding protein [bacterium]